MSGSESSKLISSHFSGSGNGFSPLSSTVAHHAFNLAAFRSPNLLAHGLAFGNPNIGNYREQSSDSSEHHSPSSNPINTNNTNQNQSNISTLDANSDNNTRNSPSRNSSTIRDNILCSDYYHYNKIISASSSIESTVENQQRNSEYYLNERHHSNPTNNNSIKLNNNNNYRYHHHLHQHNTSNSIVNNNNSRLSNYNRTSSESPEAQHCDSSHSYPTSQKSEESDYNSGNHLESIDSHSPENLSSINKKLNNMLDHHKLPLNFLGQPLAALHSMAEMKSSNTVSTSNANNNNIQQTQSQISTHGSNPHGIDTILSRPTPVTTTGLNALTNGKKIHKILIYSWSRLIEIL